MIDGAPKRERWATSAEKCKAAGSCVYCGKAFTPDHSDHLPEQMDDGRHAHHFCIQKEKIAESCKRQEERRRARGVCVICDAELGWSDKAVTYGRGRAHPSCAEGKEKAEYKRAKRRREMAAWERQAAETPGEDPPWVAADALARKLATETIALLPTGIATLDKALRGGPRRGYLIGLQGPPGGHKTSIAVDVGVMYARQGHMVVILACDEDPEGILIRVGQHFGLSRDLLDRHDAEAWAALAEILRTELDGLWVLDGDLYTVEGVSAWLAQMREESDAPIETVLIVDSIQTARTRAAAEADGPRARVDGVIRALKAASKAGHLVFATSEMSRGAYRSKDAASRIDDLAGAKESGGIEYGVHVLLTVRPVKDAPGQVDVAVTKNRKGQKLALRLHQDATTATYTEVPIEDSDDGHDVNEDQAIDRAKQRLRRVLSRKTTIRTRKELVNRAGGRHHYAELALTEMLEDGSIAKVGGCFALRQQPLPGVTP
jgi:KaiC/GvpD/RAD55 family RecA-like ATPase